ncbi:MAG: hypothetical protein RLZZ09_2254, partial [Pseudomonadota bacterium]
MPNLTFNRLQMNRKSSRYVALPIALTLASTAAVAHRQPPREPADASISEDPNAAQADSMTQAGVNQPESENPNENETAKPKSDNLKGKSKTAQRQKAPRGPAENDPQPIEEPVSLDTVEILGRETQLVGIVESGSQGVVGQNQFKTRPLERVGELVEVIPGMIATQHSGTGKAN